MSFVYTGIACLSRYRDCQGADLNKIITIWLEKIKWYSPATKQSIISSQPTFLTNRVTDWQCGDNEHSRPENENDARSPNTAIRPTSTLTNPK